MNEQEIDEWLQLQYDFNNAEDAFAMNGTEENWNRFVEVCDRLREDAKRNGRDLSFLYGSRL